MESSKPASARVPLAFLLVVLFILVSTTCCTVFPKVDSFLWLNQYHFDALDSFFIGYTFLGDGLFCIAVAGVFFCCKQKHIAVKIVISFLLSGLIAQVLKKAFKAPRPRVVISGDMYQHFIDGVTYAGSNSFPSGHTTSAFALATLICLYSSSKYIQWLCLLMALLVGYSRIYLGQHFLPDVNAGMMIGIATGILVYLTSKRILLTRKRQVQPYLTT